MKVKFSSRKRKVKTKKREQEIRSTSIVTVWSMSQSKRQTLAFHRWRIFRTKIKQTRYYRQASENVSTMDIKMMFQILLSLRSHVSIRIILLLQSRTKPIRTRTWLQSTISTIPLYKVKGCNKSTSCSSLSALKTMRKHGSPQQMSRSKHGTRIYNNKKHLKTMRYCSKNHRKILSIAPKFSNQPLIKTF